MGCRDWSDGLMMGQSAGNRFLGAVWLILEGSMVVEMVPLKDGW